MKLRILADNNTYIDEYFLGEPAVSYYLEDDEDRILFDVGYSDVFMKNANKMGIDLSKINKIVLSHGHDDHTGGLAYFNGKKEYSKIEIIAHPWVFDKKYDNHMEIGSPISLSEAEAFYQLKLTKDPLKISKHIMFLGEIPCYHEFEKRCTIGEKETNEERQKDRVLDDSAIVIQSDEGLFIITGCSHSGICNIIEHAKKVCNDTRITGILGGFHLFEVNDRLTKTIEYFQKSNIKTIYPGHCVSFQVKAQINKSIPIHEVGVGLELLL